MNGVHWCAFVLASCLSLVPSKENDALYNEGDHVAIFNDSSHKKLMEKKFETNWLMEYYDSSCGHCRNFAPTFKEFAADVYGWRDTVKIGVIDCRIYKKVCEKILKYYPTLVFYRVGLDNKSREMYGENVKSQSDLKRSLLKSLSFEPFLQPRTQESLKTLDEKSIVIVDSNGTLAQEIILDFRYLGRSMVWMKGEYKNGRVEKTSSSSSKFVDMLLVEKGGRLNLVKPKITTRQEAKAAVKKVWGNITDPRPDDSRRKSKNSSDSDSYKKLKVYKFPHFEDILSSLIRIFRDDVSLNAVIRRDKMIALKNMLSIVKEYLTFASHLAKSSYRPALSVVAKMFTDLETKMRNVTEMKRSDWKKTFDAAVTLPKRPEWLFCAGSKSYTRGYPCGLWTLFHSLTTMQCLKQGNETGDKAQYLIQSVKNFVINFFSCRSCAKHFANETRNLKTSINSSCDSMVWLWRVHNSVNKRLAGAPSEDPKFPKIQFPSSQLCSTCRSESGAWNTAEVIEFLKLFYGPKSLRMKDLKSRLMLSATKLDSPTESSYPSPAAIVVSATGSVIVVITVVIISLMLYRRNVRYEQVGRSSASS